MKIRFFHILILVFVSIFMISATIDLNNLLNYENQAIPTYITKDNTGGNPITNEGATLGRVLFYDKKLSSNNSISCAGCHRQQLAFGENGISSHGVNGNTGRHSMRLVNNRFSEETNFFWDERADSLEEQTTMPIKDHIEMGFSGTNGDPDFSDLLQKLDSVDYYNDLFYAAFGDTNINEDRIQKALAQFVRSMQSFDSKFDIGRAQANNNGAPFSNFTNDENMGKSLFLMPPNFDANGNRTAGGLGCGGCHRAPEFDIDPISRSNAVITTINGGTDFTNTKSPSLRDLFNPQGMENGQFMHDGSFSDIDSVISHYNNIPVTSSPALIAPRLRPNGNEQKLNITAQERTQLIAFLKTLTGNDIYTNVKWSDPFDANGDINVINGYSAIEKINTQSVSVNLYPNPSNGIFYLEGLTKRCNVIIYDVQGKIIHAQLLVSNKEKIDLTNYPKGTYLMKIESQQSEYLEAKKIIIN